MSRLLRVIPGFLVASLAIGASAPASETVAQEKWSFYQTDVAAGYNRKIAALALDSAGNAYTSGWTGAANAHYDFMTAKHAATTGARQWVKNAV